jgi:hypothetical protein
MQLPLLVQPVAQGIRTRLFDEMEDGSNRIRVASFRWSFEALGGCLSVR